ncbi:hypothetical protein RhiirA1_491891 [Rhizophagus irregularis]|uniref:Paired domain-containing protein n=2 Tax=Rhizophagus irregularis TaxID=588596 RepID=A0A2N0SA88_9GLOM|nr:hypothetical protein RhiirA1_491891 [Rhizophagus irregularis]
MFHNRRFFPIVHINTKINTSECLHVSSSFDMFGKELSETLRERVIGAYLSGTKQIDISVQLGIPASAVNDTIKRNKKTGSATPEKRPGRPKMPTERDTRVLRRVVSANQFSPLGGITDRLNSSLNTTFHHNTVRKYLHNDGLGSYTAHKNLF